MIKNILAVGDSFTYGEELQDRNLAWPILLGNLLNANVNNMAKPGSGNKRIIRNVMESLLLDDEIDLVLIAWSSPGRIEFADEDGIFDVWPGYSGNMFMQFQPWRLKLLEYINRHHNDEWLYNQHVLDIILLQSFLEQHNIKYLMCKTAGNEFYHRAHYGKNKIAPTSIDSKKFIGWPNEGMSEWTYGCPQGPREHFLEDGHKIVANKIYEHIKKLGWV